MSFDFEAAELELGIDVRCDAADVPEHAGRDAVPAFRIITVCCKHVIIACTACAAEVISLAPNPCVFMTCRFCKAEVCAVHGSVVAPLRGEPGA